MNIQALRLLRCYFTSCVTFNNNAGSTKSYDYVRQHIEATATTDFVPEEKEITATYKNGTGTDIRMHDGSYIRLEKKLAANRDHL